MRRLVLTMAIPVLLAGCGTNEHEDLQNWMKEATKDLRGNIPPLPKVKPYEPVAYEAGSLLDPFNPGRAKGERDLKAGGGTMPDFSRVREPLEEFPLETMKLVGVMRDKSRVIAQVLVNGKSHEVRVGNHIGQSFGKVVQIDTTRDEEKLVLKELIQEADGGWVERESALYLAGRGERK